jgi:putative DNA methylase
MAVSNFPNLIPNRCLLESNPPAIFASRLAIREGNSKKPIYRIHKWWARRLGSIFRTVLIGATSKPSVSTSEIARRFYEKNDFSGLMVLDPFVGGGTTVVEASKCKANVIGVDIDPVACFVTSRELEPMSKHKLKRAFRQLEIESKAEVTKWYRTRLADGRIATIVYAFWVDQIRCPICKEVGAAHPHYQLARSRKDEQQTVFCSKCHEIHILPIRRKKFTCSVCSHTTLVSQGPMKKGLFTCPHCTNAVTAASTWKDRRCSQKLFALEVLIDGTNEPIYKKADASDFRLFSKAQKAWSQLRATDKFVPRARIPSTNRTDLRPVSYGYKYYADLFNSRQLLCLSRVAGSIAKIKDRACRAFLATAFSDCLAANNMFCYYAFDYRKLTPLFGLHAYHKVVRPVENNVWGVNVGRGSFSKCFFKLLRAKQYSFRPFELRYSKHLKKPRQVFTGEFLNPKVMGNMQSASDSRSSYATVLNQSSEELKQIPSESVDLILSDPPYYDNLAYSELSDFYHVWLRRLRLGTYYPSKKSHTPMSESLFPSAERPTGAFQQGLENVFGECQRVLKPSGLLVFTFHHRNPNAWAALGSAIKQADLLVTNVFPVRSEGQSQFHSSEGNLKWDAVFCCRKRSLTNAPTSRGCSFVSAIKRAEEKARLWRQRLKSAKLTMGTADLDNLKSAFTVMELSNALADSSLLRQVLGMLRH